MSHDTLPLVTTEVPKCAHNEGCGMKLELESNGVFGLPVEIVPHNARTTGKNGNSGLSQNARSVQDSDSRRKSEVGIYRRW